jgi:membrane dipeptidase
MHKIPLQTKRRSCFDGCTQVHSRRTDSHLPANAVRLIVSCACLWFAFTILPAACSSRSDIAEQARGLHFSSIVIDTHDDTTQRFFSGSYDIGRRNQKGHVDIPRMREGGLDALFLSIWIDGRTMGPPAVQKALDQIDAVRQNVRRYSTDLALARTADDVRRAHETGKIAVLIGVEGGHMIGNDLRILRTFGVLGVRYMTLTHFYNNEWADSSTDKPAHNGLTEFGKDVVGELNRQGILVDISHVSDKTFYDALAVSKAPLIASHSSCRAICNHARNMSDQMIKDLAARGGVIQINYEKSFLDQAYKDAYEHAAGSVVVSMDEILKSCGGDSECVDREMSKRELLLTERGKLPHVSWEKIIEHIDHVVHLVGPEHVGLGSDFDGANMPDGMEDCSKLPKITEALLRRGYSEGDIRKILGLNLLRVLEQAEQVSAALQAEK